jgi:hypothetical protein
VVATGLPETALGWGALAFMGVVFAGRLAYWIGDRRKR